MKKLKLFSLLGLAVVIGLYSCSKGATGATGPQGPAGPDSVVSTGWTTLVFTGAYDASTGDSTYGQIISSSYLTQGILDSGVVISYVGENNGGVITDVTPAASFPIYEDYEVGSIAYYTYSANEGGFGLYYNNTLALRFVIIPSAVVSNTSALQGLSKGQIQTMSYDKITSILGNSGVTIKSN